MSFSSILLYTLAALVAILGLLTGVAMLIVEPTATQPPAPPSVCECTSDQSCDFEDDEPRSKYIIAERSSDRLFIRVVANGEATLEAAKEIISTYAKSYQRVDICESDGTERGEECMSYSEGLLVDYRTGKTIPIEL
ncbi:MAG: hypothetical protein K2M07_08225 [Muribaculaceae bacterium]|nr:hypothetical protein [Muribaculaceae bacterium]